MGRASDAAALDPSILNRCKHVPFCLKPPCSVCSVAQLFGCCVGRGVRESVWEGE